MWVYIESERWQEDDGYTHVLYTVGHYTPNGEFIPESDWDSKEKAAERVSYLNGNSLKSKCVDMFEETLKNLKKGWG